MWRKRVGRGLIDAVAASFDALALPEASPIIGRSQVRVNLRPFGQRATGTDLVDSRGWGRRERGRAAQARVIYWCSIS
jgi:hypothetical protein